MKPNMKRSLTMMLIYCMGIGGLSLFVGALHPISYAGDLDGTKTQKEISDTGDLQDKSNRQDGDTAAETFNAMLNSNPSPAPTPLPSPTPSPTPTPPPVFELEEGGYPEIEKFFQDYYVAVNSCDYTLLKSLLTNPENIQPLPDLQKETRFLDDIRDIKCYVMKSYEEGAYIVYVYHEMKYVNIKTTYPKVDKFYLITDENGNFKIFTSEMDDTLKAYYEERDQDEKVKELIENTDKKAKEALDKDVDLRVYLEAIKK